MPKGGGELLDPKALAMINHFTDGYKLRDPLTLISCYVNEPFRVNY